MTIVQAENVKMSLEVKQQLHHVRWFWKIFKGHVYFLFVILLLIVVFDKQEKVFPILSSNGPK